MLEALIVTLREGVEAALVVAIIVAFLRREGYERHLRAVWAGIAAAVAASVAGAFALARWAVNEELFEGVLYLTSAVVVASMVVWMWRHSRAIAGEMRGTLARIVSRGSGASVAAGLFAFTFLMVFREGIETVFFLSALSLSSGGLFAALGAVAGIGAAVAFGVAFVRGSVRVDLGRFFTITGIALLIFVLQLLANGYHELSEAGWVPANEATMAVIGPLVSRQFFFIAAVLVLPLLLLLVPGERRAEAPAENPAAARLAAARERRQRRARVGGALLGMLILLALGAELVYGGAPSRSPATPLRFDAAGEVRIPLAELADGRLHRYAVEVDGRQVRFIALRTGEGDRIGTAFDACLICGAKGYSQNGTAIICLHCASAIYPPSIGREGGCNPIPLAAHTDGSDLVLERADLAAGAKIFG